MDIVVVIGGSRDGYRAVDFHSKCDGHHSKRAQETLNIFRSGYTEAQTVLATTYRMQHIRLEGIHI